MRLCSRQYKYDILRRLFQRLQQCIKGPDRQHVHLINDIHFITSFCWTVGDLFPDFTNVIDTIVGSRIDFNHIHGIACGNRLTNCTLSTRASVYRVFTVNCFCKYLGNRCFSGSPCSTEQVCVSDTICFNLILKRPHNCILSLYIFKFIWPEFPV